MATELRLAFIVGSTRPGGKARVVAEWGNGFTGARQDAQYMGHRSPRMIGGTPVSILLYLDDVDPQFKQAVGAGAKVLRPVDNQGGGGRLAEARAQLPRRFLRKRHVTH